MIENWQKWEPINGLAKKYYIDGVIDDFYGFKIKLTNRDNEKSKLIISFNESVWAYRSAEEGLRLLTMENLAQKYGANFYTEWTFFKVLNSDYLNWIFKESYNTAPGSNLMHFCVVAMDDILEIIADYEPEVKVHNK